MAFTLTTGNFSHISLCKHVWNMTVNTLNRYLLSFRHLSSNSPGSKYFSGVFSSYLFSLDIFSKRNKSTVTRPIVISAINSVNGESWFPLWKSPVEKFPRRYSPGGTNCYAFCSVKSVIRSIWIVATLNHLIPNTPKRMLTHPVSLVGRRTNPFTFCQIMPPPPRPSPWLGAAGLRQPCPCQIPPDSA